MKKLLLLLMLIPTISQAQDYQYGLFWNKVKCNDKEVTLVSTVSTKFKTANMPKAWDLAERMFELVLPKICVKNEVLGPFNFMFSDTAELATKKAKELKTEDHVEMSFPSHSL